MDIFDQSYYRPSKSYLCWIGHWPYGSTIRRIISLFVICLIFFTQVAAKINSLIATADDIELLFDSLPTLVGNSLLFVKLFTYNVKIQEFKKLLNFMKYDWSMMKTDKDMELLCMYAEQGRRYLQNYARVMVLTMSLCMIMPVAPRILGIGNMSAPRPLPHNVYYFVDNEEYYYPILLHSYASVAVQLMFWIATDGIFIMFVQHACAMFSILEYKLEHLADDTKDLDVNVQSLINDDVCYHATRECIRRHIDVLSYMKRMDSVYSLAFLLLAGLNMILMSITGVRAATSMSGPVEFLRQLSFSIAPLIHLIFECYQGQRLINHGARIEKSLINSAWYMTSLRTRKLNLFMLMRSQIPSVLTAGKLFVISMEFCSVVLRMSMSYFTVLRSVG